jgi:hypothetical protein
MRAPLFPRIVVQVLRHHSTPLLAAPGPSRAARTPTRRRRSCSNPTPTATVVERSGGGSALWHSHASSLIQVLRNYGASLLAAPRPTRAA